MPQNAAPTSKPAETLAANAWQPLPETAWNAQTAAHLLRRAGWTARPTDVRRAVADGMASTIERIIPRQPAPMAKPSSIASIEETEQGYGAKYRNLSEPERRELRRERQRINQNALQDLTIEWLQHAASPSNSVSAKWVLFLGDIYVISQQKVKNTAWVYAHQQTISRYGGGSAVDLAKAMTRSPAMALYLDLDQNKKDAPNENFARELFELFTLGEGNYTEDDIKESARAFTGYRRRGGKFELNDKFRDNGVKTVFGKKGRFTGDDIVDLVFKQSAAARFLPREMTRFYLADHELPPAYYEELATWWQEHDFNLRALQIKFFTSKVFYDSAFRGNFIKSPVQFYLGLLQDLDIDVNPVQRTTVGTLRQMGQLLYRPPNVRGWVGGRNWINSATLTARRQVVRAALTPLREDILNADDIRALEAARAQGHTEFALSEEKVARLAALPSAEIVDRLLFFLPREARNEALKRDLTNFVSGPTKSTPAKVRLVTAAVLQSPDYQLC